MKPTSITVLFAHVLIFTATLAVAQAPDSVSFQGYLTNTGGGPLDTSGVDMVFKLYKGNTAVWTETQTGVPVNDGVFNVYLGSVEPLDTVAFDRSVDLGIKVGADPEITPRTKLASVPYALSLRALRVQPATTGLLPSPNLIGGHDANSVSSGVTGGTIGGGGAANSPNLVSGDFGTISGGVNNRAARISTVGGGTQNDARGEAATISGGSSNLADTLYATIGGGQSHKSTGSYATVGGGGGNTASDFASTVGGGWANNATRPYTAIAGGQINQALAQYASVGGGYSNSASGQYATIAGGDDNAVIAQNGTVAGGRDNKAGSSASVGGGSGNVATGSNATIAGGRDNVADALDATVGGGNTNSATESYSTVAGGLFNSATGSRATVPGGETNRAAGSYSFAAGYHAKSLHEGSFAWSDRSQRGSGDSLSTTAKNQFLIRAKGGVGIGTASPAASVHIMSTASTSFPQLYVQTTSTTDWARLRMRNSASYYWDIAAGATSNDQLNFFSSRRGDVLSLRSTGDPVIAYNSAKLTQGGVWTNASSRAIKTDFADLDLRAVLEKLATMPITQWRYKVEPDGVRHIGPIAETFRETFGLGEDDATIGTVDADGVALAAIQGLYELVQELQAENARIRAVIERAGLK